MRLILTFFALVAVAIVAIYAQQSFTIPAPDGTTIKAANNVWSAVPQGGGGSGSLPPGMHWDAATETLTIKSLALTGGSKYAPGQYLVNFDDAGNLHYSVYTPPASGGGGGGIGGGGGYTAGTLVVPSTAVNAGAIVKKYLNPPMPVAESDVIVINAIASTYNAAADCCYYDAIASGTNSVMVRIRNLTSSNATFPQTSFRILVFPTGGAQTLRPAK